MIGTARLAHDAREAVGSSAVGSVTRTSSQPAAASRCTWSSVAAASPVRVLVIDCTRTGAPPPTGTSPTWIWRRLATALPAGARRRGAPA